MRRGGILAAVVLGASLAFAGSAAAQGGGGGGVYLDADGVLRSREGAKGKAAVRLQRIKGAKGKKAEAGDLAYVSLPRLFAEVRRIQESGEKVPAELQTLGGLTKIQFVFVYPKEKDVVLAGPAEDVDATRPERPVGKSSGKPCVKLDDLVVALRTVGPGQNARGVGCSLDMPENGMARMQAAANQATQGGHADTGYVVSAVRKAVGPQIVRLFAVPADTGAAYTCIEADYLMKRLCGGQEKSPVPGVKSYLSMMRANDPAYNRWWFVPNYDRLVVNDDATAYEIRGKGLKVRCSSSPNGQSEASPPAAKFADMMTDNFAALSQHFLPFADLWNFSDLLVVATLARQDDLAKRAGWDLAWIMDPAGYKVTKVPTPTKADTLGGSKQSGNTMLVSVGGVHLNMDGVAGDENRSKSSKVAAHAKRPTGTQWMVRSVSKD